MPWLGPRGADAGTALSAPERLRAVGGTPLPSPSCSQSLPELTPEPVRPSAPGKVWPQRSRLPTLPSSAAAGNSAVAGTCRPGPGDRRWRGGSHLAPAVGIAGRVSVLGRRAWMLVSVVAAEAVPGLSPSTDKSEPIALVRA